MTARKFRRKPVEVEAVQLKDTVPSRKAMSLFRFGDISEWRFITGYCPVGYWSVRDDGRLRVLSDADFRAQYEEVKE